MEARLWKLYVIIHEKLLCRFPKISQNCTVKWFSFSQRFNVWLTPCLHGGRCVQVAISSRGATSSASSASLPWWSPTSWGSAWASPSRRWCSLTAGTPPASSSTARVPTTTRTRVASQSWPRWVVPSTYNEGRTGHSLTDSFPDKLWSTSRCHTLINRTLKWKALDLKPSA